MRTNNENPSLEDVHRGFDDRVGLVSVTSKVGTSFSLNMLASISHGPEFELNFEAQNRDQHFPSENVGILTGPDCGRYFGVGLLL